MCEHCKGLLCCGNHCCDGNVAPKLSVAELLARYLREPVESTCSPQARRVLSTRQLPEKAVSFS